METYPSLLAITVDLSLSKERARAIYATFFYRIINLKFNPYSAINQSISLTVNDSAKEEITPSPRFKITGVEFRERHDLFYIELSAIVQNRRSLDWIIRELEDDPNYTENLQHLLDEHTKNKGGNQ